ncbi:hypothetical protein KUCAC02_034933 [Chaenocephalus aceratus]|nr:hypothetical protein KUCAC02_034933 [Chaenocephalus aceratus]
MMKRRMPGVRWSDGVSRVAAGGRGLLVLRLRGAPAQELSAGAHVQPGPHGPFLQRHSFLIKASSQTVREEGARGAPSSQTGSGRRGLVVPPPLRRGPEEGAPRAPSSRTPSERRGLMVPPPLGPRLRGGGSWCPLLSDPV